MKIWNGPTQTHFWNSWKFMTEQINRTKDKATIAEIFFFLNNLFGYQIYVSFYKLFHILCFCLQDKNKLCQKVVKKKEALL